MKALLSRGFCFSVCVACLAGCGFFGSKKEGPQPDFKTQGASESTKTALSVPPDLIAPTLDPRFAFDEGKSSATFSAYSKEGKKEAAESTENVLPKLSKVRMDRAGSQRWLVVPGTLTRSGASCASSGREWFCDQTGFARRRCHGDGLG